MMRAGSSVRKSLDLRSADPGEDEPPAPRPGVSRRVKTGVCLCSSG